MARHGDRRGFDAPQRSPEELAETLAKLAESTGGPAPRHRRHPPRATPRLKLPDSPAPTAVATDVLAAPATKPRAPAPTTNSPTPPRRSSRPASPPPPPPIKPTARQAPAPPADGLVIGTPLGETSGARLSDRPRSTQRRSRASNGAAVGPRVRSRAADRPRQRRRLAAGATGLLAVPAGLIGGAGSAFSGTTRRLRPSRSQRVRPSARARGAHPDARSRKLRRLYAPLLAVLALVILIGLLDQGKGHGTKQPAHSATPARSVFPKPSAIPTATQPVPSAPAVTTPPPTVTTTAHKRTPAKRAPAKRPSHHTAGHAKAHKPASASSPTASTSSSQSTAASAGTIAAPAPVYRSPAPRYVPPPPARQTLSAAGALSGATKSLTQRRARHRKR